MELNATIADYTGTLPVNSKENYIAQETQRHYNKPIGKYKNVKGVSTMRVPEVDWVKGLRKCCEDITDDAENIIGDLHNVRSISIEINMDPGSIITYTVKHEKVAPW